MRGFALLTAALLPALLCGAAAAQDTLPPISGQVRVQWDDVQANNAGPLAAAHALQRSSADLPASGATLHAELRASGKGITGVVTLQQQRAEGQATESKAWVNELYASQDAGAWQFSAGKKIVSWDLGYGYRPNDMVQQETRRTLISSTPEGRPLLLAEHFTTSTAWSLVWVNPTAAADTWGAQEPALAARLYQRSGAADWYGFARVGAHSGSSLGAALAWVASDALELHGSARLSDHAASQVLLGGTWTTENQLSLLAEAWWDGTAALQRNLMLRLSWQHDAWQPALDVLYTPQDRGRVLTASLNWQGDRVQVQGGLRHYGGPAQSVLAQLPSRRQAYLALTWAF